MLILTRKKGEAIVIDDNIEITVIELSDGRVKIGIDAPKEIDIHRREVYDSIKAENKEATMDKNINLSIFKDILKNK